MTRVQDARPDVGRQAVRDEVARQERPLESKATQAPARTPTDGVDKGKTATAPQTSAQQPMPAGKPMPVASPFASLVRGSVPLPPRVLAAALGLSTDLSPSSEILAKLVDLETAATRLGVSHEGLRAQVLAATDKVRQGAMLTLADGLNKHTSKDAKVPRGLVANLGETIASARSAERAIASAKGAMTAATSPFPMGMDINAFVQAVLRECYLLQCEILKDYADKLKALNEVKKRIRKKLQQSRELAGSLENGDPLPEDFDFELFIDGSEWERRLASPETPDVGSGAGVGGDGGSVEPGDEPVRDAVPIPGNWRQMFYVAGDIPVATYVDPDGGVGEITLASVCEEIRTELSKPGADWEQVFRDVLFTRLDNQGSERVRAFRNGLGATVGLLRQQDFETLVGVIVDACRDADAESAYGKLARELIGEVVNNATFDQLCNLRENVGEEGWRDLLEVGAPHLQLRELEMDELLRRIPAELRDDPETAALARHLAQMLLPTGAEHDDDRRRALVLIRQQLPCLDRDTAERLFAAMFDVGAVQHDEIDQLFFALDPDVLSQSRPDDWSFLDGTGSEAARCVIAWRAAAERGPLMSSGSAVLGGAQLSTAAQMVGTNVPLSSAVATTAGAITQPSVDLDEPSPAPPEEGIAGEPPFFDEEMEAYIKTLEEQLNTIGDDAQLANVDLQNALQKQQQTLQMMSNISKMLHDTAMSIIRKIGS